MIMKQLYQEPVSESFEIVLEGLVCLSGGQAGESGRPGSKFDPNDDVYDYDGLF